MSVIMPYVSALLVLSILTMMVAVLIWAWLECRKMNEHTAGIIFFIMAGAMAVLEIVLVLLSIERGLA